MKILGNAHGLIWRRVRMYYHRLPNLRVILQVEMVVKIRKGIRSKYFLNHECNCNCTTNMKVTCSCGGECRTYCVVYKVACRQCISFYVGKTQNTLKNRMEQHFQDVTQKVQYDKTRYFCGSFRSNF